MSQLTATVHRTGTTITLVITGPCGTIHTAEIVPDTKSPWTRSEFDWAVQKTGIAKAELYDAVRTFRSGEKVSSHAA